MTRFNRTLLILIAFSVIIPAMNVSGETPEILKLDSTAAPPSATIDDFSFLVGNWSGPGLDGMCYEVWSEPSGGTMACTFKMVKDDKVSFYELAIIAPVDNSYALLLKHFNPDMVSWEEKEEVQSFPLVKVEKNIAYFDGITMQSASPDSLDVYLLINSGGEQHRMAFRYTRDSE